MSEEARIDELLEELYQARKLAAGLLEYAAHAEECPGGEDCSCGLAAIEASMEGWEVE